jgi:hypothetical protein
MSQHPRITKHPSLAQTDFDRTVPLGLHGDGAPVTKTESLFTVSWNSLLGTGKTMDSRFIYTCIRKKDIGPGTLDALWKYLAWSFDVMMRGEEKPALDYLGQPYTGEPFDFGGWRGTCIQLRGDWEFYASVLGFPRWNTKENMCFMCLASAMDNALSWTSAARGAGWRPTIRSHESYLAELIAAGKSLCGLFLIPGLRLEGVMVDVLHTVDLGLAAHIIANIFVEVMRLGHWGKTQEDTAKGLQADIHEWYKTQDKDTKASKIQGEVTYERIKTSDDWPKLKAKAAATRKLSRHALELCRRYDSGSEHDKRRLAVADLLVRFYDIIETGDVFLSDDAKLELSALGRLLFGTYMALSREALDRKVRSWKPYPKFHLFLHLCEIQAATMQNPRCYWTYCDEDLQRHLGEIATSCHMSNLAPMTLYKWIVLVFDVEVIKKACRRDS